MRRQGQGYSRELAAWVAAHGGRKMLYSQNFYSVRPAPPPTPPAPASVCAPGLACVPARARARANKRTRHAHT